ncbi:MAG: hypothetical protein HRU19_09170 [Pseudobacteriovorax sp.]|nr:hypothetical protein [Pseudobacteriovorax sp.]
MTRFNNGKTIQSALIVSGLLISASGFGVTSSKEFGVDLVNPSQYRALDNSTSGQYTNQSISEESKSEDASSESSINSNEVSAFGKYNLPYGFYAGAQVDYAIIKAENDDFDSESSSVRAKPFLGYGINDNWTVAYEAEVEQINPDEDAELELDDEQTVVHTLGASFANEKFEAGAVYKTEDESDIVFKPQTLIFHGKVMLTDSLNVGGNIKQEDSDGAERITTTLTSAYSLNPMWDFEGALGYGLGTDDDVDESTILTSVGAYLNVKENVRLGTTISYSTQETEVDLAGFDSTDTRNGLAFALNANYRF